MAKKAKATAKKRTSEKAAPKAEEGKVLGSVSIPVQVSIFTGDVANFNELVIEWSCLGLSEEPDTITETSGNGRSARSEAASDNFGGRPARLSRSAAARRSLRLPVSLRLQRRNRGAHRRSQKRQGRTGLRRRGGVSHGPDTPSADRQGARQTGRAGAWASSRRRSGEQGGQLCRSLLRPGCCAWYRLCG